MGSVAQQQQCPICYDDYNEGGEDYWPCLACGHSCCSTCLKQWFQTEEKTGQAAPTCPVETCRQPVEDATLVLGRAFVPAGSNGNSKKKKRKRSMDETIDESTKAWLEANTLECGGCQGRITKSSGCDKLQCICGYRVCWKCRKVGAQCGCNPGHGFVDNVTGLPSWSGANVADRGQLQNMKQFLEERRRERPRNSLLDLFGPGSEFRSQRRSRLFSAGSAAGDPFSPSRMAAKMRHLYPGVPIPFSTPQQPRQPKRQRSNPNSLFGLTSFQSSTGPLPFPFWGPSSARDRRAGQDPQARGGNQPPPPFPPPSSSVARIPANDDEDDQQHPSNDLLRPTLFRDFPDIFGTNRADTELTRALHLSLRDSSMGRAAFAPTLPSYTTTPVGRTAAHPISVDDDEDLQERSASAAVDDNQVVESKPAARVNNSSCHKEYEDDMAEAIRLSMLENSGASVANPVFIDDSNEEKKDDESDSKPAAVILTQEVSATVEK
ncbi:expressed unknown protein [Seminavis robusta]|uniref:RING-type domain-containing protein n=1 Tax=Seminavis robusta TaxID=568900 RepID=A0A9N8HI96_9STRA|nr:expressed unknown protein [Seminavis robusta]|eukprot:Sro487_g152970.1 n/a (492) ;mRNA; r:61203-62807